MSLGERSKERQRERDRNRKREFTFAQEHEHHGWRQNRSGMVGVRTTVLEQRRFQVAATERKRVARAQVCIFFLFFEFSCFEACNGFRHVKNGSNPLFKSKNDLSKSKLDLPRQVIKYFFSSHHATESRHRFNTILWQSRSKG